jgi:hypothetical protein
MATMPSVTFDPPLTPAPDLVPTLRRQGYAVLDPRAVGALSGCSAADLSALQPYWDHLPPDGFLKDGGRYRRRRHSCFTVQGGAVRQVPHRPHWQPVEYNALHGGMQRHFEPVDPAMAVLPGWERLLRWLGAVADASKGPRTWFVEAHAFRIDTADGIGRPTPEGAHRDGVDFVAVFLVARSGVKGGETRVFEAAGPQGQRFTLAEPWSLLLLDDERVIHETTPIQPAEPRLTQDMAGAGHRDTLVITLRAGAFLGEDGAS